jgi:hypothetical protein
MKYCPVCDLRFDEEIIKFCTKDGTPLIEETPSFTAMPSEALDDDFGQETVIRRREDVVPPTQQGDRIVIPTEIPQMDQQVRPRTQAYYPPPPPPANTTKTVVLTIAGTLAAVGLGALLFWLFQSPPPVANNINLNAPNMNMNTNLNSNVGFDSNFNFNTNANFNTNTNFNLNTNLNANMRTPSPTQTPRPSPSPTMTPRETPEPTTAPSPRPTIDRPPGTAMPANTPRVGPRPPVMTSNRPSNVN